MSKSGITAAGEAMDPRDPVALTAELVRCESVTPAEGGAIRLLRERLRASGFRCAIIERNGVSNLFARWDGPAGKPTFGFNGHTDVVPTGNRENWTHPPFSGEIRDGMLWGRGAADMKSGVAAFVSAAESFVAARPDAGSVVLTVTGDEEGMATDGTVAILDWMEANGETMDVCIVGEPTCPSELGEAIKIGRRGSLNAEFRATGIQGHSAYPERARNPVAAIAALASELAAAELDQGTPHFAPSTLAITGIDTGNPASNVIPGMCTARANIRFNDAHSGKSLSDWLSEVAERTGERFGVKIDAGIRVSGECFLTEPDAFADMISDAVHAVIGRRPEFSTSGGTSDARFIKRICPVLEFGLVGATIHQTDEHVAVEDIRTLARTYEEFLHRYFA